MSSLKQRWCVKLNITHNIGAEEVKHCQLLAQQFVSPWSVSVRPHYFSKDV